MNNTYYIIIGSRRRSNPWMVEDITQIPNEIYYVLESLIYFFKKGVFMWGKDKNLFLCF